MVVWRRSRVWCGVEEQEGNYQPWVRDLGEGHLRRCREARVDLGLEHGLWKGSRSRKVTARSHLCLADACTVRNVQ